MSSRHAGGLAVLARGARLIARFVRHRPASFAIAVTGAAAFAVAIIASAAVVGRLTDELILPALRDGADVGDIEVPLLLLVLGVALWKSLAIVVRRTAAGWLQARSAADLRSEVIAHQFRLPFSWYASRSTGDLLSLVNADVEAASFVLAPLPFATGTMFLLVGTVGLITATDVVLGAATVVVLVAAVVLNVRAAWRSHDVAAVAQRLRGEVSETAHESFDGALTVKALGREREETGRFREASDRLRDQLMLFGRVTSNYRPALDAVPSAASVLVLVIGASRVASGSLTSGDLVEIAYLLSLLAVPLSVVGYVMWDLANSVAGWDRVAAVLALEDRVTYGTLPVSPTGGAADVGLERVAFSYGDDPVLIDVRGDIRAGSTVALVGATGSGKTTLAGLLARLYDPGNGVIHLDGRDLRELARGVVPAEVTLVAQDRFLFDDTVAGNISLGEDLSRATIEAAARLAGAHEFVTGLTHGYDEPLGERGTSLSGGQQQRLVLARALARSPRLLVLDDATSAVDPSVEQEILRRLRDADLPSTVVVVAYRSASVALADEVLFLADGRIAARGTHAELVRDVPAYAELLRAYETDADGVMATGPGGLA